MKKLFVFLLINVLLLSSVNNAYAEYRTGSAAGDSIAYGSICGILAGGAAAVVTIFTGGLALPVVAVAGGAGLIGGGIYGAIDDNKTIKKDIAVGTVSVVSGGLIAKPDVLKTKEFQQRALIIGAEHIDDVDNLMKIEEKIFHTNKANVDNVMQKSKKTTFSDRLKNANNQDYNDWRF